MVVALAVLSSVAVVGGEPPAAGAGVEEPPTAQFYMPPGVPPDNTLGPDVRVVGRFAGSGSPAYADGYGVTAAFDSPGAVAVSTRYAWDDEPHLVFVGSKSAIHQVWVDGGDVEKVAGSEAEQGCVEADDGDDARFTNITHMVSWGESLLVGDCGGRVSVVDAGFGDTRTLTHVSDLAGLAGGWGSPIFAAQGGTSERVFLVDDYWDSKTAVVVFAGDVTSISGLTVDDEFLYVGVATAAGAEIRVFDWDDGYAEQTPLPATALPTNLTSAGDDLFGTVGDTVVRWDKTDPGAGETPVAGSTAGFADGFGADARFSQPGGLASDGKQLLVADTGNHRVRTLSRRRQAPLGGNVIDAAHTPAFRVDNPASKSVADPVNVATGNFHDTVVDVDAAGGAAELAFERTYSSQAAAAGDGGVLGAGWFHRYETALSESPGGVVSIRNGRGRALEFLPQADGSYDPPDGVHASLAPVPGGWDLTYDDGTVEHYDPAGTLTGGVSWDGSSWTVTVDGAGRVDRVDHSGGQWLDLSFDPATGQLKEVTASDGRAVSYDQDTSGFLQAVTLADSAVWAYSYDAAGQLLTATDPAGVVIVENAYDTLGRVVTQWNAARSTTTFTYDWAAGVTTVTDDATGETTTWDVDHQGRLLAVTDPSDATTGRSYDIDGQLTEATGRDGTTTTFAYDDAGRLTAETTPGAGTSTYTYDQAGRVTSSTEPGAGTTTYTYDGDERIPSVTTDATGASTVVDVVEGLIRSRTDADGVETTFTYHPGSRLVHTATTAGATTEYVYDPVGRLTAVIDPLGGRVETVHDAAGRVTARTEETGGTQQWTYNPAGQVLSHSDEVGNITVYAYDPATGWLDSVTDPTGAATTYDYDHAGRVVATYGPGNQPDPAANPDGDPATTTYGPLGRVVSAADPTGVLTTIAYDAEGRVTARDTAGAVQASTYDEFGRVATETDPAGGVTTYTYDQHGRLDTVTVDTTPPTVTTYGYDTVGRTTTVTVNTTPPTVTTTEYTPGGRVAAEIAGTSTRTDYTYDAAGRLAAETDGEANTTVYGYDPAGRRTSETNPAGETTIWAYDPAGRVTTVTDPAGVATTSTYLPTGWLASEQVTGQATPTTYTYDDAGRTATVTDPAGAVTATVYDDAGRVTERHHPGGGVERYTYDPAGRLLTSTNPTGDVTTHTYEPATGRLASVTDGAGNTITYGYDQAGRRTSETNAAGETTTWAYDPAGRVTTVTDPAGVTDAARRSSSELLGEIPHPGAGWNGSGCGLLGGGCSGGDEAEGVLPAAGGGVEVDEVVVVGARAGVVEGPAAGRAPVGQVDDVVVGVGGHGVMALRVAWARARWARMR